MTALSDDCVVPELASECGKLSVVHVMLDAVEWNRGTLRKAAREV